MNTNPFEKHLKQALKRKRKRKGKTNIFSDAAREAFEGARRAEYFRLRYPNTPKWNPETGERTKEYATAMREYDRRKRRR